MSLGSGHVGLWLGRQAHKETIASSCKHFKRIFTIVDVMQGLVYDYINNEIEEATKKAQIIAIQEREADQVKEEIIDSLMKSSLHPMDQDEIIRLILTSDDIASQLKSCARKLLYTHSTEVPPHIKDGLKGMVDLLAEESRALRSTIEALLKGMNDVREKAEKTERIEETIDDLRVDLLAQILKWGDVSEHITDWLMLKEAVESMETASDKIEDTADVLRQIAILRGKPL